jgi:molybdate transport system regulatory protein
MRIAVGEAIAVGPGKIALIEAVHDTKSITAAAKSLGMSYRRAWMLVDQLNASLKKPAVRSVVGGERGGGSELTEVGVELIRLYRRIEERAMKSCAADLERLMALVAT